MNSVIYSPGKDPEKIKKRVENFFAKIKTAYPDKIVEGLSSKHKHWG